MTKRKITLPTQEQKIALHTLAGEIKKAAPWKDLWDMDTICIKFASKKEPIYCSIMGRQGTCYAVALFDGDVAASTLSRMAYFDMEDSYRFRGYGMQDAVSVYWGNRDELSDEERREIKELGFSYRGENNWVYFKRLKPGCMPGPIHAEHAQVLLDTLPQVLEAYKDYIFLSKGRELNEEKGEAIWREEVGGKWLTKIIHDFELPELVANVSFRDVKDTQTGLSLLSELKSPDFEEEGELEIDILPMPASCGLDNEGYDIIMRNLMVVEAESGFIIDTKFLDIKDDSTSALTNELIAIILGSKKRPSVIHVFDDWVAAYIEDFCEKLDIEIDSSGVPFIDQIANTMCSGNGPLKNLFKFK
jgi:hypothetical protein